MHIQNVAGAAQFALEMFCKLLCLRQKSSLQIEIEALILNWLQYFQIHIAAVPRLCDKNM